MSGAMYFHDANVPSLVEQIRQLPRADNDVVVLFIAEHSTINVQELWTALCQQHVPIVGGVFPGVIYGDQKYDTGLVANVMPLVSQPTVVTGLEGSNFRLNELPPLSTETQYTALVLVDGLTKHIALFLDHLFRLLGNKVHYIGAGAGSLSFQQKPCLFDSHGIYQDAAVIVWLKTTTSLGVRHGWQTKRGPFIATHTEGTIVQKLYNQPAFRVYSQFIKAETGKTLTNENFFEIAKEYPLGIFHPKMDHIVRDPIAFTDDESLVCVGEVPPRSLIYILHGNRQSLIENARLATEDAVTNTPTSQHNLIVDCISRVLFLEGDFGKELTAVRDAMPSDATTPFGVLSLGEIATFKTGRVEFFNKTIVVGALHNIP